jgi:GT2 family glycosyltransferase
VQLSIIVPLYNALPFTQAMVTSLQTTLPPALSHEIILIDDGSTDGTRDWLATLRDPPFRVVLNERNLGFAAANNRGAAAARGEYLALLNNDLVLTPGWLEPMLATHARLGRRAGLVGNIQYRADDGALDHAGISVTAQGKIEHLRALPASVASLRDVFAVTAACCLVRREDFLAVGGFDEGFVNGGEDVDLTLKLRAGGKRTVVALGSSVRHHVSAARGPTTLRDEQNSRRLFQRWPAELERAIAQACRRASLRSAIFGRRRARLLARSARFREETRWAALLDGAGDPLAATQPSDFAFAGIAHADTCVTAWLPRPATILLPAGFPRRNFFLAGYVRPADPTRRCSAGPLGLRVIVNRLQSAEIYPLPEGNFNFGIDAPAVLPDRPTRIEVFLLGVGYANRLGTLGRLAFSWLQQPPWRAGADVYHMRALDRRLRLTRIVGDDRVLFDFSHHPPLMVRP